MKGDENLNVIPLTKDNYDIYKDYACVYLNETSTNYQDSVVPFDLRYNKPYVVKSVSILGTVLSVNIAIFFIITDERGFDTRFHVTRFCVRKSDHLTNRIIEKHIHEKSFKGATTGLNPKDLVGAKKVNVDCVPTSAIIETAIVLGLGAKKYGPYNWREQPIQMVTYVNAAIRHLYALLDGEDLDSETGRTHFASVMAGMAILIDAQRVGTLVDNRCKIGTGGTVSLLKELEHYVHPFVKNNPDYNFKDQ